MGYTHYYYRNQQDLDPTVFAQYAQDCQRVCTQAGIPLAGWDGTGEPVFTAQEVAFNGVAPKDCETFSIQQSMDIPLWQQGQRSLFDCCKTQRQSYDVLVTACLILYKHHFGAMVQIHSDGDNEEWEPARRLCQQTLGYGADVSLDEAVEY